MTTHQHHPHPRHHPLTDDATIDGADLLAEIRAQLGYGPAQAPTVAAAPPTPAAAAPPHADPVDKEFTIDGFEFLQQIQAEANLDPLAVGHVPSARKQTAAKQATAKQTAAKQTAATQRWVPPGPVVPATAAVARPGQWQLAAIVGAFVLGVMVTALAMTLLGWGLGA